MFGFFFTEGPVTCFEDAEKADMAKFGRWHRGMLERGVYLAPSAYEVPAPARPGHCIVSYSPSCRHWPCGVCLTARVLSPAHRLFAHFACQ